MVWFVTERVTQQDCAFHTFCFIVLFYYIFIFTQACIFLKEDIEKNMWYLIVIFVCYGFLSIFYILSFYYLFIFIIVLHYMLYFKSL